jgi:hypothetical protein
MASLEKNKEILKRFRIVQDQRKTIQETWDHIERLVVPYRGRFFRDNQDENSIEYSQRHIFDSTAPAAHKTLSSTLHSGLTSPTIQWFDFRFRDQELNKAMRPKEWLQQVAEIVHHELIDSSFNLEITETYQDLVGFGTSTLTMEEADDGPEWKGINFKSVPLKEGYQETDSNGRTLYFYRLLKWTATKIVHKFGNKVPESIMEKHKKGSTERHEVLFAVYPRKKDLQLTKIVGMEKKVKASRRPFVSSYILCADASTLGTDGGYYEQVGNGVRWETVSDSEFGHSPAMVALADIITLNEARKMQLSMAEKLIDPPILTEESNSFTDLDMRAGKQNVVRDIDRIKSFESGGSFPVSDAMVQQLQAAVRNYFMVDQLVFPEAQGTPMTATEAQIRWEQMNRLLATPMGRIQNDILTPILITATRMLARAGKLPEPPAAVLEADAELDFIFIGSIARAQKVDRAAAIERLIMTAGNMAEVLPDMLDNIDPNETIRWIARDLNTPASVMRDLDDVEKDQSDRKQKAANMQDAEIGKTIGESQQALGDGAKAMNEGGVNEPEPTA